MAASPVELKKLPSRPGFEPTPVRVLTAQQVRPACTVAYPVFSGLAHRASKAASATHDSGGILLSDPHKRVISYVSISYLSSLQEKCHSGCDLSDTTAVLSTILFIN